LLSSSTARLALLAGVIGPPLFVVVFFVDGLIHPAYNPVTDFVSELSRGELGWLQITNFLIFAVAMLVFATGIRWGTHRSAGSAAGAALFAIIAAGLIVSGLFVTDAHTSTVETASGTIHNLAALPVFAGVTAACFVFARRFRGPLRVYSTASGILVLVFFFATFLIGGPLGIMGILQRVTIVAGWAWITVLAIALLAEPAQPQRLTGS
jgi:hypothetical membrane protein